MKKYETVEFKTSANSLSISLSGKEGTFKERIAALNVFLKLVDILDDNKDFLNSINNLHIKIIESDIRYLEDDKERSENESERESESLILKKRLVDFMDLMDKS